MRKLSLSMTFGSRFKQVAHLIRPCLAAIALTLLAAAPARAVLVTYDYVGNPYTTDVGGVFIPGEDRLIGSFTVDLPDDYANLAFSDWSADITSFTFYTANSSWNISYSGTSSLALGFQFSTDASGNILDWTITSTGLSPGFGFATRNTPDAEDWISTVINLSDRYAYVDGDPGVWSVTGPGPVSAISEPGILGLMLAGMLGLLRTRKHAHTA